MSDRKRTIDDTDDVDDEDFLQIEEDEMDTDLALHAAYPGDVTGPSGTIAREDDDGAPEPEAKP